MPVVDPTKVIPVQAQTPTQRPASAPAQQPTPQPWPTPRFPVRGNPAKQAADARAETQIGLGEAAGDRAERGLEMEAARLGLSVAEFKQRMATLKANGGVDTTASQDMASGHAIMLQSNLDVLSRLGKEDPRALLPTWKEKIVKGLTNNDPDYTSWAQSPSRQVADSAYKNILESAIYLSTGAAAPEDQVKRIASTLMPSMFDKAPVLAYKKHLLETYIAQARERAGPADIKAQQALAGLTQNLDNLYGGNMVAPEMVAGPDKQLSGDTRSVPVPPEMQQEYAKVMSGIAPGKMTVDAYRTLIGNLYGKYGYTYNPSENEAAVVDRFNKTGKFTEIGPTTENLNAFAKPLAAAGADKGVIGDAYALAMNAANAGSGGLPMALAGEGGREAARAANEAHPVSATVGDIVGSVAPTMALEAGIGKLGVKAPAVADILANALYGGSRGAAESGGNLTDTGVGALGGAGGSLLGRGLVKGARGFMGQDQIAAIDSLAKPETFEIPGRDPLPVTDAVPAQFQGMDDAALRQELERTKQGQQAWDAYDKQKLQIEQDAAKTRSAMEAKFGPQLTLNAARKQRYIEGQYASGHILQRDRDLLEKRAEEMFPTTIEGLAKQNPEEVGSIFKPQVSEPSFEPRDILNQRQSVLQDYLERSAEPTTATIPGVDMTTLSRAGMAKPETVLSGMPVVNRARNSQMESYNRREVAQALKYAKIALPDEIPAGAPALEFAQKSFGDRYDALLAPIKGRLSSDFSGKISALDRMGDNIRPDGKFARQWANVKSIIDQFRSPDGTFTGEQYKNVKGRLEDLADNWTNKNLEKTDSALTEADYRDGAGLIQDALRILEEQVVKADPARAPILKELNRGYAKFVRLKKAALYAKDNDGIFAPDQLVDALYALEPGTSKTKAVTGTLPGLKEAQQAKQAIGPHSNDPTIWQSWLAPSALVGTTVAKPLIGGPLMAAALAAYTPGVKRGAQALVEGKIGQALDAKIPDLAGKVAPSDVLSKLIAQYTRRKLQGE